MSAVSLVSVVSVVSELPVMRSLSAESAVPLVSARADNVRCKSSVNGSRGFGASRNVAVLEQDKQECNSDRNVSRNSVNSINIVSSISSAGSIDSVSVVRSVRNISRVSNASTKVNSRSIERPLATPR